MEIYPKDFCIFVASHISRKERIPYLMECIQSLLYQQMNVYVYVSISFSCQKLFEISKCALKQCINSCYFLKVCFQNEKTSQMKHYNYLLDTFGKNHKWILFCDDDDNYRLERTFHFAQYITKAKDDLQGSDFILGGLYESVLESHKKQRQEYWTYMVSFDILNDFYKVVKEEPAIINHKCCDVLFAEYLRRKNNNIVFLQIKDKYYNYRIEDNSNSVTGFIKSKQDLYTLNSKPPNKDSDEWDGYVEEWERFLNKNIEIFLHDTFLKTIVGYDIEKIYKTEFLDNYVLIDSIKKEPLDRIYGKYNYIRSVCEKLYDVQIV